MGVRMVETRVCDLPHENDEPVEPVTTAFVRVGDDEGEFEVCEEHAEMLRAYLPHRGTAPARRAPAKKAAAKRRGAGGYTPSTIRAWAAAHDIDVPATGRIPNRVIDQYRAATGS